MITEAQKLELQSLPIALSFKLESHREGRPLILESIFVIT
jgi:hypothetical protein